MNPEKVAEEFLNKLLTPEKFWTAVNELVWKEDITYMEAVMLTCDSTDTDPEDLTRLKLISPLLKSKLEEEAIANGNLKPSAKLPV